MSRTVTEIDFFTPRIDSDATITLVAQRITDNANSLQEDEENTELMVAAANNNYERLDGLIGRFQIQSDANLDAVNRQGMTALMMACAKGNRQCVKILLERGAAVDAVDIFGRTTLMHAVKGKDLECVSFVVDALVRHQSTTSSNFQPRRCCIDVISALKLEDNPSIGGASINSKDLKGMTALMYAASLGATEVVGLLVSAGASVDATLSTNRAQHRSGGVPSGSGSHGSTALMLACVHGHERCVRGLLTIGASPHTPRLGQFTALMAACREGWAQCAILLLEYGADAYAKDVCGMTALIHASSRGHVDCVEVLLTSTVGRRRRLGQVEAPLGMQTLWRRMLPTVRFPFPLWYGHLADLKDVLGFTALMHACRSGHVSCVRTLLQHGASTDIPGKAGQHALLYACWDGWEESARMLLEAGANVDGAELKYGVNALMLASREGHTGCVSLLLQYGADVGATRKPAEKTALVYACEKDRMECVKLLLDHGASTTGIDEKLYSPRIKGLLEISSHPTSYVLK